MDEKKYENVDNKLYKVKYKTDDRSHLQIADEQKCLQCIEKVCTIICPARVYNYNETEKKLTVSYEKCLECGACKIVCKNVKWEYPRGGKGVVYKNS